MYTVWPGLGSSWEPKRRQVSEDKSQARLAKTSLSVELAKTSCLAKMSIISHRAKEVASEDEYNVKVREDESPGEDEYHITPSDRSCQRRRVSCQSARRQVTWQRRVSCQTVQRRVASEDDYHVKVCEDESPGEDELPAKTDHMAKTCCLEKTS